MKGGVLKFLGKLRIPLYQHKFGVEKISVGTRVIAALSHLDIDITDQKVVVILSPA
ncbi:hypothetical protein M3234_02975 [Neobacillus niacini]|nr:hypothetical protein [Neobacillus niacini]